MQVIDGSYNSIEDDITHLQPGHNKRCCSISLAYACVDKYARFIGSIAGKDGTNFVFHYTVTVEGCLCQLSINSLLTSDIGLICRLRCAVLHCSLKLL